jgi:hypothetical protein
MDPLLANLLDLHYELRSDAIPLTIGGGFGLFLKRRKIDEAGERTLLTHLPEPRATNDLDLFIRAEILADLRQTRCIADAMRRLGYEPVEEAKYMQWKRQVTVWGVKQEVKIDLLVGPLGAHAHQMKINGPRVRPKGEIELHAHRTDEALAIDTEPLPLRLSGKLSSGAPHDGTVFLPRAFTYLMMKLFAFKDRKADARKELGQHHALDLYTIVGLMTEAEYGQALEHSRALAADAHVSTARQVVASDFAATTGLGILRLGEHKLFRPDFQVKEFMTVLKEMFSG